MKKAFVILSLFLLSSSLFAKNLQAYLSYATFVSPADGPYIETYLSVVGKSVEFVKNANGKFQATVQVSMIFRKDSAIYDFKKTNLMSPETEDTSAIDFAFMDQQRILLPNGDYDVEIEILDLNKKDASAFKTTESLSIDYPTDKVRVSGAEFIESYKKSESTNILSKIGYDLVPYSINFFPQSVKALTFYAEIYNTDKVFASGDKFIINYYLEFYETEKALTDYYKFKKEIGKPVAVVFDEFDITNLPSGNYNLVIEVKDKENAKVTSARFFFQRSNPAAQYVYTDISSVDVANSFVDKYNNIDTLKDYINSVYPISTQLERLFAASNLGKSDLVALKQYFYNFWTVRNSSDPAKAWYDYALEVKKVNKFYSNGIRKGYETDRGRVYLEYGPPNNITESVSDPSAYPYEIWQYYTLENQRNKKFVFCLSDIGTNDYELIHSDAYGEINDPAWQKKLVKRNTPTNNYDQLKGNDYFGGKSEDFYKNPR